MTEFFYGRGNNAAKATETELKMNAERLRNIVCKHGLILVGVNMYYKTSCACIKPGDRTVFTYSIYEGRSEQVRLDGQMGYGYADPWKGAPNMVKIENIDSGQMELEL